MKPPQSKKNKATLRVTGAAQKPGSLAARASDRGPDAGADQKLEVRVVRRPQRPAPTARRKTRRRPASEIEAIFKGLHDANPAPKGELEHTNAFTLLVAVVLSAQATDAGVNKATRGLFALADTPEKMSALGEDRVRDLIKTIGLFRNKAKNVILLSQRLVAEHGGEVPRERAALEALPGVGRKTANVVLNIAFGEPTIAVDTHVFRLAHRLGLSNGKTPEAVEQDLMACVPAAYLQHAHHWLILHGRYVCKAQRPDCARCVIAPLCTSKDKTV